MRKVSLPPNIKEIISDRDKFAEFMSNQTTLIGAVAAAVVAGGDTMHRTRALEELPEVVLIGVTTGFNTYMRTYDELNKGDKDADL